MIWVYRVVILGITIGLMYYFEPPGDIELPPGVQLQYHGTYDPATTSDGYCMPYTQGFDIDCN